MTIAGFGFDVRCWDGNPDPIYTVEYSTDSGATYTSTGIAINNAFLDNSSAWKTLTFTLPSPTTVTAGQLKVRVVRTNGERIMIDNFQWTTGIDTTPPTIATRTPADNATNVPAAATTALVIVFSENITKGTGNITLTGNSTVTTIPVTDTAVSVSGVTATITLPASLASSTAYYVNIDAGAFKDAANNNFTGIADTTTWNFTTSTPDLTAPARVSFAPADNSSNAIPTTNLVISYDEGIVKGNGTVAIKKSSDASVVESIAVSSGQVTVSGSTATIDPSVVLDYATGYYVEVSAGAFTDAATNGTAAISGSSTWNFTTRAAPAVVISQYYEGASSDKFIELKNLTGSDIALDGYRVTAWSNTSPANNQDWKSGTNTTTRITDLSGYIIPANGSLLVANSAATVPVYAAANFDVSDNGGCTAFNGDDSVVLYNGPGFTQAEVVDAVSFVANDGADKSFYRLNHGPGFDFNSGSSILNYSGVWATKTLAEVASALESDAWYLSASQPIGTLTLSLSPSSINESTAPSTSTATVTRSGDTSSDLIVLIASSNSSVAEVADEAVSVTIPAGQSSAQFVINAKDNLWLIGDQAVTFTVSAIGFLPASAQVTVLDDPTDPTFPVVINEIRVDDDNGDGFEYFELYNAGSVAVSLDNLSYIVIGDGTGGSGVIENVTALATGVTLQPGEFYLVAKQASLPVDSDTDGDQVADFTATPDQLVTNLDFENEDNVTHLLVSGFTGSNGQDLDTNDDGTLDSTPWAFIADGIGLLSNVSIPSETELAYGSSLGFLNIGPGVGMAGDAATSHVYRTADGGTWALGPFGTTQTPDNSVLADVKDTPGISNVPVVPPSNTFANWMSGYDFSGFTNPDLSATGDPDNDGLANSLENILGSSPAAPSQGLTNVSTSSGNLIFRHTRNATPASDLTASYEWSTDLTNWRASSASAGGITVTFGAPVTVAAGTPDLVEVTATITGGSPAKVFARYKVVK